MTGRRWLRAASDTQWVLSVQDASTGVLSYPTAAFVPVVDGATVHFDGSGSFSTSGTIVAYHWDFGDGATADVAVVDHVYAVGSWTATLSVTDSNGLSESVSRTFSVTSTTAAAPVARLTATMSGLTVSLDATSSTTSSGTIASYAFSFGDNATSVSNTTGTTTHTYAAAGSYVPTVTVLTSLGASASTSVAVTAVAPATTGGSSPAPYTPPWQTGTWDEGIPTTLRRVNYTDLYSLLTSTEKADPSRVLLAIAKLPGYLSSMGWGSYAAVQFPNGFDEVLPGFTIGASPYWTGLYNPSLVGLLGGMSNGVLQARLTMQANAMTAEQLSYITSLTSTGGSGSGYTTNSMSGLRFPSGQQIVIAGMQFDGNDQQTVTDYLETGPANWGGIALYKPGTSSIVQNTLLRGWGKADSSSPPGEVGSLSWTRDVSSITRRVEISGIVPSNGQRRSGGFMFSASDSPTVVDGWLHDTYASGWTFSFAGSIAPGNYSQNFTVTRGRAENNANHNGYVSRLRFTGFNQEEPHGTAVYNQPTVGLDVSTNPYWDSAHMSYSNKDVPSGDVAAQLTVNDPVVLDAATGGAYAQDNGCFSIMTNSYSTSIGLQTPIVTVGGVQLTPWIRTGAGYPPSYVTPDKYFIWKHQN